MTDSQALLQRAQAFVDRKYIARADARQQSMGLAYVEAEREDLAREIARFVTQEQSTAITNLVDALKDARVFMQSVLDERGDHGVKFLVRAADEALAEALR